MPPRRLAIHLHVDTTASLRAATELVAQHFEGRAYLAPGAVATRDQAGHVFTIQQFVDRIEIRECDPSAPVLEDTAGWDED